MSQMIHSTAEQHHQEPVQTKPMKEYAEMNILRPHISAPNDKHKH